MAVRRKRSVSIPPGLDHEIEAAAAADGTSYSAWLAAAAHKELVVRAGLEAVTEFEQVHGAFTDEERAEAQAWASAALEPWSSARILAISKRSPVRSTSI